MPTNKKKDIDGDDTEEILELYKEKSKSFNRSLMFLLIFAVFFLFIIFIPYTSILTMNSKISGDRDQVQNFYSNLSRVQNRAQELQLTVYAAQDHIKTFFEYILGNYTNNVNACNNNGNPVRLIQTNGMIIKKNNKDFNETKEVQDYVRQGSFGDLDVCRNLNPTLRNFTTILYFYRSDVNDPFGKYKAYASYPHKHDQEPPTLDRRAVSLLEYYNTSVWHVGSPFWATWNSNNKIDSLFRDYYKDLDNINYHTNALNDSISEAPEVLSENQSFVKGLDYVAGQVSQLEGKLENLQSILKEIVPDSVSRAFGTTGVNITVIETLEEGLSPEISNALNEISSTITNINTTIGGQLNDLQNISSSLDKTLERLEIRGNETAERLQEIQFPFGTIPIGINESISLFPLGLGTGFLICASLLADTIRVRKDFHINTSNKTADQKKIDQKVSLLAPLWVDPLSPKSDRILKFMVLVIPTLFFLVSVILLIISWNIINKNEEDLTGIFIGDTRNNMILYLGLHLVSAGFFVYGYWRIITELQNYKKCFPST
jgi:hypothetical protein